MKTDFSVRWECSWPLSEPLSFIFHWTPVPGAVSTLQAQTSAFSVSWAGCCEGGLAREKPACLAPQGMGKADVCLSAADQSFFSTFFPLNFAPGLWDEIRASCPSWAQSQRVHILPGESPLAPSHWPEGPEISKTKTGCPTPIAEHQPCVNGSCTVPPKSIFSKAHQNCALPPSHTLVHSPHCPLLKMWTESEFYLISDLVQAHISSISGTISVMNCRWSY